MLKYGKVNQSVIQWAPISKFTILDKGVKDGIDYHMLEFDQREIDLDDLVAPVGHVVVRNLKLNAAFVEPKFEF